jgi:hypothetical protein
MNKLARHDAHAYKSSTREVWARRSQVKVSLGYIVRPCLKKTKTNNSKKDKLYNFFLIK